MRRSRREIAAAIDDLASDDDAGDADPIGDVIVSWEQPDDWEPDSADDALVIDFTSVDT